MEHAASQPSNASFIPAAAMDLLLAVPRLAHRAGALAFFHMPEAMDNLAGKFFSGGSGIADATTQHTANTSVTMTGRVLVQGTAAAIIDGALADSLPEAAGKPPVSIFTSTLQSFGRMRNFGGIFSYLTSRWALTTFAAAIILNRTQFYGSSREPLRLRWYTRLAIYIIPLVGVFTQMLHIAQALKCQTSPDFALLRYGDPLKNLGIDFGGEGGFLYKLSSFILFWEDDASCCAARNMSKIALGTEQSQLRGSLSLLYRFFVMLCASQAFDTMACSLQGKRPVPETGMTLFEHSLAFAECEALISSAVGFGFFGPSRIDVGSPSGKGVTAMLSRSEVLQRLNVPAEVLFMCIISCFSHMSSAFLAVLGIRHKVRLVNTAIWACCYIGAFFLSFSKAISGSVEEGADLGILRFPTVCIVGFIPHLLIGLGTIACASIYGLALLFTTLSVPDEVAQTRSFRERLSWAYHNLQANVQFSSNVSIRLRMSEDFYTTLLKIGFSVLTAASEAVYLNEGSRITVAPHTWVEQKRIDELALSMEMRRRPPIPPELLGDGIARGIVSYDHQNVDIGLSPYARERRSKPVANGTDKPGEAEVETGLGVAQRRGRTQLTLDFVNVFFWFIISLWAQLTLHILRRLGMVRRPRYLLKAAGISEVKGRVSVVRESDGLPEREFLIRSPDGRLFQPVDNDIDVEDETRRMWKHAGEKLDEDTLSSKLYGWWQSGGWFGELDNSGDFDIKQDDDDDTTSVISMSTNASTTDDYDDHDGSGSRTPTQRDPLGTSSREGSPEAEAGMDLNLLSRLLNPQSAAEREEARLLSYKLQSNRPVTRSQYRRDQDRNRMELLRGLRSTEAQRQTEEEEEQELEQFILSRRSSAKAQAEKAPSSATWETGADGMGEGGPQCVVCQCTPRTILVWPCGCLSMCDECRVGLAARNHTKCICCRTEIAAYSRLFVP